MDAKGQSPIIIGVPKDAHIHILKDSVPVPSVEIIKPLVGLVGGEPYPWLKVDEVTSFTEKDFENFSKELFSDDQK